MKKKLFVGLVVSLLALQLVPTDRENPPVTGEIDAPTEVLAILERACYDCHSNETAWPWYSRIAPISFLIADDVKEGREHLNFSEWDQRTKEEQEHSIAEVWNEVEEGEMPLWFYLPLHPGAKLEEQDHAVLRIWSVTSGGEGQKSGH